MLCSLSDAETRHVARHAAPPSFAPCAFLQGLGEVNLQAEVDDAWGSEPSTPRPSSAALAPSPGLAVTAAAFVPATAAPTAAAPTPETGVAETAALKTAVANVAAGNDAPAAAAGPSEVELAMKVGGIPTNDRVLVRYSHASEPLRHAPCSRAVLWDAYDPSPMLIGVLLTRWDAPNMISSGTDSPIR